jgi:Protein of unknown function (DUF2489)
VTVLKVLAVVVVLSLTGYAGWLHYRLWKQRRVRIVKPVDVAEHAPNRVDVTKSLYLIADAFLDDKMTATEACMRICGLANHIADANHFRREYGVLFRVAEATAHIPILEDWQRLPKEQKYLFNKERRAIELKYQEAVRESVGRVRTQFSPQNKVGGQSV